MTRGKEAWGAGRESGVVDGRIYCMILGVERMGDWEEPSSGVLFCLEGL